MGNVLDILKNWLSFYGKIWVIVGIFCLKSTYGATFTHSTTIADDYIPGAIKGKYRYGYIGGEYNNFNWLKNTLKSFYGNDISAVCESLVPSAMVDVDGVLYTIDLYKMSDLGATFAIKRFTSSDDGSSIALKYAHYYPWGATQAGTEPHFGSSAEENYFKNFFHNCLQPCIAQDVSPARHELLSIFFRIPIPNYFGGGVSEGIVYQDFYKDTLETYRANGYPEDKYYFNRCRYRKSNDSNSTLYDLEKGNYKAWKYGLDVYLDFINNKAYGDSNEYLYHQYNVLRSRQSISIIHDAGRRTIGLSPRYIYNDGYVYGIFVTGYTVDLFRGNALVPSNPNNYTKLLSTLAGTKYLESTNWGHSESPYDFDFFIEDGSDGKKIFVYLGFAGGGSYSSNGAGYNWSSTYCNWTTSYAALVVQSIVIPNASKEFGPNDAGTGDWVQNVIYITPYTRASGNFVDTRNTSKGQVYRLYQNTHRMCTYTSPLGNKYVIYCYCYPGKEPQLYLGYAQYWIDSNNKIVLGPKSEFRKTEDQWSESIASCFTSCSRIISMDCKAGHLWITWMNEDNKQYRYFHILAKDLIGE